MMSAPTATSDEQVPILVVEDDRAVREALVYNLRGEGYTVYAAGDGIAALDLARNLPIALVVLDLMLPGVDGLYVCRQLRAKPETARTPILMLTAKGDETEKVIGLEMGADDYVTKPFSWKELRARIRALLRRRTPVQHALEQAPSPTSSTGRDGTRVIHAGDVTIDPDRREVQRGDRQIGLPARLFDLLVYMVRNKGLVLTRDRLLQHVWGYDYTGDTRTVDVHMRWLREKMEEDPSRPTLIQTVRGVGYRYVDSAHHTQRTDKEHQQMDADDVSA